MAKEWGVLWNNWPDISKSYEKKLKNTNCSRFNFQDPVKPVLW